MGRKVALRDKKTVKKVFMVTESESKLIVLKAKAENYPNTSAWIRKALLDLIEGKG